MNTTFDAPGVSHFSWPFMLLLMSLAIAGGCAQNNTQLELRGDPRGTANYSFREVIWRPSRDVGGHVEMIGYGFIPFINDPISRDWNPHWPQSGYVTFRLLVTPEGENRYAIKMLGPSTSLGPGDDEVLTAVAENVQAEAGDGDKRIIRIVDVPTQSRNKPNIEFMLSGSIIATPTSDSNFERQLQQFNYELNLRGPTTRAAP